MSLGNIGVSLENVSPMSVCVTANQTALTPQTKLTVVSKTNEAVTLFTLIQQFMPVKVTWAKRLVKWFSVIDHSIGKKMGSRSITTLLIQKTCLKCSIENLNLYDVSV